MYSEEEMMEFANSRANDPMFKDEVDAEERAWYSYAASVPTSTVKGSLNTVQNVFESVNQFGAIVGTNIVDYTQLDRLFGEELTAEDKSNFLKKTMDNTKSLMYDIQRPEDPVDDFFFSLGEAAVGFIPAFRVARAAKMGTGAAAVTAGAFEGAIASDVDDKAMSEQLFTKMLAISPEAANDFKAAMDVSQTPSAANILMRKAFAGLDMAVLGYAGEKVLPLAADKGVPLAKAAAKSAFEALPKEVQKKTLAAAQGMAETLQSVTRWKAAKTEKSLVNFIKDETVEGAAKVVAKTEMATDPAKSLTQNIEDSINININDSFSIDADNYKDLHTKLANELEPIARQIANDVVNMKDTKGAVIGQGESAMGLIKSLGDDYTKFKDGERLRGIVEIMAHNIIVQRQSIDFATKLQLFKAEKISPEAFVSSFKQVLESVTQRDAALSAPATALRTGQEVGSVVSDVVKAIRGKERDLVEAKNIIDALGAKDIPTEELSRIAQDVGDSFWNAKMAGASVDEISDMFLKSAKAARSEKTAMQKLKKFANHVSRTYTANLLSATPTIAQNTLGAITHSLLMFSEDLVRAAGHTAMGRKAGQMTFGRAVSEFAEMQRSSYMAVKITLRATYQAAMDVKSGTGVFTSAGTFMDDVTGAAKGMAPSIKSKMFAAHKEDIIPPSGAPNANLDKATRMIDAVGKPVFGIIKRQDAASKMVIANKKMAGFARQAIYDDDTFGLVDMIPKERLGDAREIVRKKILDGAVFTDDVFSPDDLAKMGIKNDDAAALSLRIKSAQEAASKEAFDDALEVSMQSPLSKPMEQFGEFLQEKIPAGRILVPFFNTPINIISKTIERLPVVPLGEEGSLGLPIHPKFYMDFAAGGARREKAISKAMTGMVVASIGRDLATNGIIVPIQTTTQDRIAASEMLGLNNAGIKIGDNVYSLAFMGPLAYTLFYGANMETISNRSAQIAAASDGEIEYGFDDMFYANVFSLGQMITEAPYMKPLEDLMGLAEWIRSDPDKSDTNEFMTSFGNYAAQLAGNLVPYSSLQRQISKDIMEYNTLAKNPADKFFSQFWPAMSEYTAHDFWSEPEKTPSSNQFMETIARFSELQDDDKTLIKLFQESQFRKRQLNVNQPIQSNVFLDGKYGQASMSDFSVRAKLTPEQFNFYHETMRKMNPKKRMSKLVNSKYWNDNTGRIDGLKMNTEAANAEWSLMHKQAMQATVLKFDNLQEEIAIKRRKKGAKRAVPTATIPALLDD